MARAGELGVDQSLTFLREVDSINMRRRDHAVELAEQMCGGRLVGLRVAVLGLSFKPDSDDVRDSPALDIAGRLWGRGANVVATDPAGAQRCASPDPTCTSSTAPRRRSREPTSSCCSRPGATTSGSTPRTPSPSSPYPASSTPETHSMRGVGRGGLDYRGMGRTASTW